MKRSQPTTFNCYKKFKPSDGNRAIVREHMSNSAANVIAASATATMSDHQYSQGMEYGVGIGVGASVGAGERYGYTHYTSIWAPD